MTDASWAEAQARALLAEVRPQDPAGQARRRVAVKLISDLERIYQRKKAADKELTVALKATGTTLTSLEGIGPSGAARFLVEAGDITRFPAKGHFASWNGTAPLAPVGAKWGAILGRSRRRWRTGLTRACRGGRGDRGGITRSFGIDLVAPGQPGSRPRAGPRVGCFGDGANT